MYSVLLPWNLLCACISCIVFVGSQKKHMLGRHVMGWGWQEHVQDENNIKCIILARHFVKVGCDWIFTWHFARQFHLLKLQLKKNQGREVQLLFSLLQWESKEELFATQMTSKIHWTSKLIKPANTKWWFPKLVSSSFSVARPSFHMSSRESLVLQDEAIDYVVQAGSVEATLAAKSLQNSQLRWTYFNLYSLWCNISNNID